MWKCKRRDRCLVPTSPWPGEVSGFLRVLQWPGGPALLPGLIPVGSGDKILAKGGALWQTVSTPLSVPPLTSDSCLNLAGFAAGVSGL